MAPHLYFTQFLDDKIEEQRDAGISMGVVWLRACVEILVYTPDGISGGMKYEIEEAEKLGLSFRYMETPVWRLKV
jgi:hypothetical protein